MKNTISIYQLKKLDSLRNHRWTSISTLLEFGIKVEICNYNKVWNGNIKRNVTLPQTLDDIFRIFNIEHPSDFKGHSLSISDIVEIEGKFFYCDSLGWKLLNNTEYFVK